MKLNNKLKWSTLVERANKISGDNRFENCVTNVTEYSESLSANVPLFDKAAQCSRVDKENKQKFINYILGV
jgi:hypothetical protein